MVFGSPLRAATSRSGSAPPHARKAESSRDECTTDFTRYGSRIRHYCPQLAYDPRVMTNSRLTESVSTVARALDGFRIELPSWGFANTGTRFGKYLQPAAAATTEEKLSDAGLVHTLTGSCPTVALHVQ